MHSGRVRLPHPRTGVMFDSPVPKFGHGATAVVGDVMLIGCYHPSQQNTFTGRLTPEMLDDVFRRARERSQI